MNRIFICLCVLTLLSSCGSENSHDEQQGKLVVTSPLRKDTFVTQEYVCQIRAIQHIELRALERGFLEKIFVDEGKFVKKGQLMFQILPLIHNAEFKKTEAEAKFAQIEYENTKQLADSNVVSQNELAMKRAKFEKAKAEMLLAKTHLQFTEIRAPFSGIMDRFQSRIGSLINEGDLLTTLSDNSKMWVYFNVPEALYLNIKTHQANNPNPILVKLRMANNEIYPQPGIVETIEADFNNETGNIAFRATFPNPNSLLRHGETGNVQIKIPLKNVLIIPQKATFEVLEKQYVFLVNKDNVVEQKEIIVEAEMPNLYIVRGIKESDKILLEGIRKVKHNDKISYDYQDAIKTINSLQVFVE